jgi:hypothetical protein
MSNYALIRNNEVLNVIVADDDADFLEHLRSFHNADLIIQSDTAGIGFIYDPETNTFSKPVVVAEDNNDADNA